MGNKILKNTAKPPNAGGGRPKGAPNKITSDVREMIRNALETAGGESYLAMQAVENPNAFMSLVGKIIPREIEAKVTGAIELVLADRLKAARERLRSAS